MSSEIPSSSSGVTWARVEVGFYVASEQGNFVGYVDETVKGGYSAHDMMSRSLGLFPDFESAVEAVTGVHATEKPS